MHTPIHMTPKGVRSVAIRRFVLCGALVALTSAAMVADALTLTAVQSRKAHGATSHDLPIDVSQNIGGAVTVESRAIGAGHQIVFQFDVPVTFGVSTAVDEAGAPVTVSSAAPAATMM